MHPRICLELGLNKEETLREPMRDPDGNIDTLAMALRRRIFWSCFSIDKYVHLNLLSISIVYHILMSV